MINTPSKPLSCYITAKTGILPQLNQNHTDRRMFVFTFPESTEIDKIITEFKQDDFSQRLLNEFSRLSREVSIRKRQVEVYR